MFPCDYPTVCMYCTCERYSKVVTSIPHNLILQKNFAHTHDTFWSPSAHPSIVLYKRYTKGPQQIIPATNAKERDSQETNLELTFIIFLPKERKSVKMKIKIKIWYYEMCM